MKLISCYLLMFVFCLSLNAQTDNVYHKKSRAENKKGSSIQHKHTVVDVSPSKGELFNGHYYVDLGLPSGTLWATCNVGAYQPEQTGDYFAWGETTTKGIYNWSTYKWCDGYYDKLTKYCFDSSCGKVDNKIELELNDDAAYVNWGEGWCMPTEKQFVELLFSNYTTVDWNATLNGVDGQKITSKKNGKSIFLPDAGSSENPGANNWSYWSRSIDSSWREKRFSYRAYFVYFFSSYKERYGDDRCHGNSVRPVRY